MKRRIMWLRSLLALLLIMNIAYVALLAGASQLFYNRTVESYKQSIMEQIKQETISYANIVSKDIEFIQSKMNSTLIDNVLQRLVLRMDQTHWTSTALQDVKFIWNSLSIIKNSSRMVSGISIYIPDLKKKITSESVLVMNASDFDLIRQHEDAGSGSSTLLTDAGLNLITDRKRSDGSIAMMIVAQITPESMMNYLIGIFEASNAKLYLMIDQNGRLHSLSKTSVSDEIEERYFEAKKVKTGTGSIGENGETSFAWASLNNLPIILFRTFTEGRISAQMHAFNRTNYEYQILTIAVGTVFMVLVYILVCMPLWKMQRVMRSVENGDLDVRLGKTWSAEFQYLYHGFDKMEDRIQNLIEQELMLHLKQKETEIKMLQYQINPHFLYNTYFLLQCLLDEEDYESAMRLANLMGTYMRYITMTGKENTTLIEEIDHAEAYLQIQKMRFSKRVQTIVDELPERRKGMRVPRLIVQPLLENAFEHGIKQMLDGAIIRLAFIDREDSVDIIVEDNGSLLDDDALARLNTKIRMDESTDENIALRNLYKRIGLFYGSKSDLKLERSDLGGLRCVLHICCEEENRNVPDIGSR